MTKLPPARLNTPGRWVYSDRAAKGNPTRPIKYEHHYTTDHTWHPDPRSSCGNVHLKNHEPSSPPPAQAHPDWCPDCTTTWELETLEVWRSPTYATQRTDKINHIIDQQLS